MHARRSSPRVDAPPPPTSRAAVFGAAFSLLFAGPLLADSAPLANPPALPDTSAIHPVASFRVTFGLHDVRASSWAGRIVPAPGQRWCVEEDRLRRDEPVPVRGPGTGPQQPTDYRHPFPDDRVTGDLTWIASTRPASLHGPTTEWHVVWELPEPVLQHPSVVLHLTGGTLSGAVQMATDSGNFSFVPGKLTVGAPVERLDGAVRVERVPPVERVAGGRRAEQDFPSLLRDSSGALWVAWQEYDGDSDSVCVRSRADGRWGQVAELTSKADVYETALGEDRRHRVWAVWSAQSGDRSDLVGRSFDGKVWSEPQRLTATARRNIHHRLCTDSRGDLWLVWQAMDSGFSEVRSRRFDGESWSGEEVLSAGVAADGDNWSPVIAAGPGGMLAVAWDGYAAGNYDVYLRRREGTSWREVETVAATPRFEAHASVAIDADKRIWLAWDESGSDWGKDTGFLVIRKGTQLHESRTVRVACLDDGGWREPRDGLDRVLDPGEFWELPHLQLDSSGRPWLLARHLVMRQPDTPLEGPIDFGLWEIHATHFDGEHWSAPVCLPRTSGRNDMLPATTVGTDGPVWAAWATDRRDARTYLPRHLEVDVAPLDQTGPAKPLTLEQAPMRSDVGVAFDPSERAAVRAIRAYRVEHGGRTYSIFRGDLHRHTDISVDGDNDGSLLDAYRYARDAASLDFLGVADHTAGMDDRYSWWRSQKTANLFQIPGAFAALYGYERSIEYPNGHRNVFFAHRGVPILPIGVAERDGSEGAGKLYEYLRKADGFSIPHTTGRSSGTDWRDNDPKVEYLVELFQGLRDSYEYPGAPRPKRLWSEWLDPSKPIPRASSQENSPSFRPLGFVRNALDKGYRLGFIASSDHISTHISYACLLAEELTPGSLVEAVRARRAYAATANIILDVRYVGSEGEHLMGEEFASAGPVTVKTHVVGTSQIRQIDLFRNGKVINTVTPATARCDTAYTDTEPRVGVQYYYVRVIQKNGDMAWGSPAWVRDAPPGAAAGTVTARTERGPPQESRLLPEVIIKR